MKYYKFILLLVSILPICIVAKRGGPKDVPPIYYKSIKYSTLPGPSINMDHYNAGGIQATDSITGKILWSKKIYELKYISGMERDNCWVFIDSLSFDETKNNLIIQNEDGNLYKLNLKTHDVIHIIRK